MRKLFNLLFKKILNNIQGKFYSQKSNDYSQKSNDYSQKSNDYSQKSNDYSQKPNDYSQKSNDYSQKPNDYSQKSNDPFQCSLLKNIKKMDDVKKLSIMLTQLEPADNDQIWSQTLENSDRLLELAAHRLSKADFYMAKKFVAQADVKSQHRNLTSDAYRAISEAEIATTNLSYSDEHSKNETFEKFDFIVVHSEHVGITNIHNMLSLHPEVMVPQKYEIDDAIVQENEAFLVKIMAKRRKFSTFPNKTGIVQHGYIAGASGDIAVAKRMSKIVHRDNLIHIVRNPKEVLKSLYNNYLIGYLGNFAFPGMYNFPTYLNFPMSEGVYWPPCWEVPSNGLPKKWEKTFSSPLNSEKLPLHISAEIQKDILSEIFRRMKYAGVAESYGKWFDKPTTLDAGMFFPDEVHKGAPKLFESAGVDSHYKHPAFNIISANHLNITMINNFIELTGLEHPIQVSLAFPGRGLYSYTFLYIELASVRLRDDYPISDMANQIICLVATMDQWMNLSKETRTRFIEEGIAEHLLEHVLLPAWAECHYKWSSVVNPLILNDWSDLVSKKILSYEEIRSILGPDLNRFLNEKPEFAELWNGIEDLI